MKTLISTLALSISLFAASQPNTEVYLFDLNADSEGTYQLSNPKNISTNDGYDNQPYFWPDGKSVIYSRTVNGQTEIARYFLNTDKTKVITSTKQGGEYSPTPMPDGRISSIRLDTTGLQLLYAYSLSGEEEILVPKLVIGYHAWLNKTDIVAFVLGEPATMQIIDTETDESLVVAEKIGRSLHKIPNSKAFSYLDKSNEKWVISSMEPKSGKINNIALAREGAEDYCWTPNGDIIMGQGSQLWGWNKAKGWNLIRDLSDFGLTGVTRINTSPNGDHLVLVVDK